MLTPLQATVALLLSTVPAWAGAPPPAPRLAPPTEILTLGAAHDKNDVPVSLLSLTDDELQAMVESDVSSLGSLAIGRAGSGLLVNPVQLPPDPRWEIAPNAESWGTAETIAAIETVIATVHELFTDTPALFVGDISSFRGGRLKRHESHQMGRDVDLGFYYRNGTGSWFAPGSAGNLDLPRNWALLRALVTRTDVEAIFLDTRIQKALYQYAASIAEDRSWLDRVFGFAKGFRGAVVKHLPGHRTHYHVRFFNPVGQELGRRAYPFLVTMNVIDPPMTTVRCVARAGQTIGQIAARYGTSVAAVQRANRLTTTRLRAGRSYRIPVRAAVPPTDPIQIPPRLLPPTTPDAMAGPEWPTPESLYGERPAPLSGH